MDSVPRDQTVAQAPPLVQPGHFTNAETQTHSESRAVRGQLGLGLSHLRSALSGWISCPLRLPYINTVPPSWVSLWSLAFPLITHTECSLTHNQSSRWLHNGWGPAQSGEVYLPFLWASRPKDCDLGARVPWVPRWRVGRGSMFRCVQTSLGLQARRADTPRPCETPQGCLQLPLMQFPLLQPSLPAPRLGQSNSRAWPTNMLGRGPQLFWEGSRSRGQRGPRY